MMLLAVRRQGKLTIKEAKEIPSDSLIFEQRTLSRFRALTTQSKPTTALETSETVGNYQMPEAQLGPSNMGSDEHGRNL